jgi:hypothetical protein
VPATGWDQARIGNDGTSWWLNAIKGAYFFDVDISSSFEDDTVGRKDVIGFGQAVVAKLTSGSPAPASFVLAPNAIPGWTFDQNNPSTANGPAVATNVGSAENLIDGASFPFYDPSKSYQAKGLAWEVYTNGTYTIDLKIWQMPSAAATAQLYTDLFSEARWASTTWTTCSGTDPSNPCP